MAGKSSKPRQRAARSELMATQAGQPWRRGVLLPALASSLVLLAAYPPLSIFLPQLAWLAWLAPIGWLWTIDRDMPVGRRGYGALWLAGCVFWLPILHGIRLGYWPLYFGWLALSLYLAVYVPVFVGLTRFLRLRWRLPLVAAAPIVWTGLELIRSYLLTGYAANTLAHSQAFHVSVLQIADQLGCGGIGFVMMSVSVAGYLVLKCLLKSRMSAATRTVAGPHADANEWRSMESKGQGSVGWQIIWSAVLLVGMIGYGQWRLAQGDRLVSQRQPLLRVLLVQENTPSIFDGYTPELALVAWKSYATLTEQAAREHAPIDLVVWPESTFTGGQPWLEAHLTGDVPDELKQSQVDKEYLLQVVARLQDEFRVKSKKVIDATGGQPYLLVGSDAVIYRSEGQQQFNSAMFIGPDGNLLDRYGKMHRVMFGEYIPLGPLLQWLRDLVELAGIEPGREAKSFQIGQVRVAPNICFETMMPRVVAWQVRSLANRGESPDILINLTNDSWFRGSSMLDHHLACSVLCAVENRRPLLIAANTGISGNIDGCGRIVEVSGRLQKQTILAQPTADGRWGMVQWLGYPLSWLCAAFCLLALAAAWMGTVSRVPFTSK